MSSKSKLTGSDGTKRACKRLNKYLKSMSTSLQRDDQQPGGITPPMADCLSSFHSEKTVYLKLLIKYNNIDFSWSMQVKSRDYNYLDGLVSVVSDPKTRKVEFKSIESEKGEKPS